MNNSYHMFLQPPSSWLKFGINNCVEKKISKFIDV